MLNVLEQVTSGILSIGESKDCVIVSNKRLYLRSLEARQTLPTVRMPRSSKDYVVFLETTDTVGGSSGKRKCQ